MIDRIINLIVTEFNEVRRKNNTPLIQTEIVYSKRSVDSNGVTPRVVWSFNGYNIAPTRHLGTNPHQGHSMEFQVVAHCYAKTPEDLLFLINDVLVATRIVLCEPSIRSASGDFLDPGEVAQNGYGSRLSMTLDINIFDPGLKYVILQQENLSASFINIQPQT